MFRSPRFARPAKPCKRRPALAIDSLEDRTVLSATRTLGGLEFVTPGDFTTATTPAGTEVRADGPVQVGIAATPGGAFVPLLQFGDGVSFLDGDPAGRFSSHGDITGIIAGQSIALAGAADRDLSAPSLLTGGLGLGGGNHVSVAGADFHLTGIDLDGSAVKLQGDIQFPQLAGLDVAVQGDDYVVIDTAGVHLTGLDVGIADASFQRAGFGFNLNDAHLHYSTADNEFSLTGDGSILVAGREVGIRLDGDGLVIQDGQLAAIDATVTAPEITVGGASLTPTSLHLEYVRDGDTFAVTGAAELAVGGMTMGVELGDAEEGTQGLVLAGGQLQGLDMAVTTDFAVGGLTFTADHLRVAYTPADDRFVLTGAAGTTVLGNSLNVRFGGDGAEGVVIDGGRLTRLDATVSGSVAVGGVSFASDGLHLVYTPGDNTFELTGSATAAVFGNELAVALGGDDTAGLRIVDGRVESVDVAVTGGFRVGGMAFQATDLRMTYSAADNSFRVTGTASATFANSTMSVTFAPDGGIVIENGKLTHLDAAVNGEFSMMGLTVEAEDLGMSYDAADDRYAVYGGAFVSSPGGILDHVGATLGDAASPGLVVWQGQVQDLDIGIDGTVRVGGMALEAKDLTLRYDVASKQLQLVGGLGVSLAGVFHAEADLTGDGLTIDASSGAVHVHGLRFQADADFGAVHVHDLVVEYQDTDAGTSWAAAGTVQLGGGIEVGGAFEIVNGKLSRIAVSYDKGGTLGIPILDTGLYVTHLAGDITNLDDPANVQVALNAQVTFARSVKFMGHEYALFQADGTLTVNKDDLSLEGNIQLCGGYMGAGSATVDLNWAEQRYEVGYDVKMYAGVFHQTGTLTLDGKAISIDARAALEAPDVIKTELANYDLPYSFAEADFHLRIDPDAPASENYAEASFTTIGFTATVHYDFDNNLSFSITNGAIKQLTKAVEAAGKAVTEGFTTGGVLAYRSTIEAGQAVYESMNAAGHLATKVTYQAGQKITETYNALGNVVARTTVEAGRVVNEWMDQAGKLTKKVINEAGQKITELYNAAGKVVSRVTTDAVKTVTETMNAAGKLTKKVTQEAGQKITETYDMFEQRTRKVVEDGTKVVTTTYAATRKLTETTEQWVTQTLRIGYFTGRVVLKQVVTKSFNLITAAITRTVTETLNQAGDLLTRLTEQVGKRVTESFHAGSRIAYQVVTETLNSAREVTKKVTETFDAAGNLVRRETEQAGKKVVQTFEDAGDTIADGFTHTIGGLF